MEPDHWNRDIQLPCLFSYLSIREKWEGYLIVIMTAPGGFVPKVEKGIESSAMDPWNPTASPGLQQIIRLG